MNKEYAAVMGMSKDNKVNDPVEYWQVVFNMTENECIKGKRKGYILTYTSHKEYEEDTIKQLNEQIKLFNDTHGLMWKQISQNITYAYCLVSGDGEIVTKFNKEEIK
jgi:hypothetical protein